MVSDQGQGQQADLVDQRLEAVMFLYPLLDLSKEILGDIDDA